MTKEQIKQHKNTMIWFIDNPSKGLWFKQDGSDWILTKSPTFKCYEGLAYVPNDEYASLRMAEAEGKTIQFKAFEEWEDSSNFNWSQPLEYYRIKPDYPTLKVDDKVLVWDNNPTRKLKRYFSHFDERGSIHCFSNGYTSWSSNGETIPWANWELVEG